MKNYFMIKSIIGAKIFSFFSKPLFKKMGKNVKIINPVRIIGFKNISLGNNVLIQHGAWISAVPLTGKKSELIIGDNVRISDFSHIFATNKIIIEKNTRFAPRVYLSDNLHNYEDVSKPICDQGIKQINPVVIKEGSLLGENVAVIGATVGKNSIVGSNSVVTKDIPDYCVAVGSPAKIIKRYDFKDKKWKKTNEEGEFI